MHEVGADAVTNMTQGELSQGKRVLGINAESRSVVHTAGLIQTDLAQQACKEEDRLHLMKGLCPLQKFL